eukprot:scaffold2353_cov73-Skeletonema_marinoi.AAC.1
MERDTPESGCDTNEDKDAIQYAREKSMHEEGNIQNGTAPVNRNVENSAAWYAGRSQLPPQPTSYTLVEDARIMSAPIFSRSVTDDRQLQLQQQHLSMAPNLAAQSLSELDGKSSQTTTTILRLQTQISH